MSTPFSSPPGLSSSSPPDPVAPYYADAFEFLGARIHADLLLWSPHHFAVNEVASLSRRAIAARATELSHAREKVAHWVKLKAICLLKSCFSASLSTGGKRTVDVPEPPSNTTRQSKRQRHATPPTSSPPSSTTVSIPSMDSTFTEDSLAPDHRPIPHSTRSTPHTRI